ncbi:MAG: phosphoribosylaminoimidazolesuccinocarboxamide synthase [Chthonomonadales bacterium]
MNSSNATQAVTEIKIHGLPATASGKVREIFDLGETLLLVTTDRISAYDCIMPNGIPDKGRVLTALSEFWFQQLRPLTVNHLITTDINSIGDRLKEAGLVVDAETIATLEGRTMLVVKAEVFPVECVVRGYISGSLWAEYIAAGGTHSDVIIHGLDFPAGLKESERLPQPIFTPATKATSGHDENISFERMCEIVGRDDAELLRTTSLNIYTRAATRALNRGLIIADTKFEFGRHNGVLTLVDEALTPDSSRFWTLQTYEPGRPQNSFDKQYLRDWLTGSGWNREPPAPMLPDDIVLNTSAKYKEAFRLITGRTVTEV